MSDLIPELAIWIKEHKIMRFEYDSLKYIEWWLKETIYSDETPYIIVRKMFELHGDVFGLIKSGLAIDTNTIK